MNPIKNAQCVILLKHVTLFVCVEIHQSITSRQIFLRLSRGANISLNIHRSISLYLNNLPL